MIHRVGKCSVRGNHERGPYDARQWVFVPTPHCVLCSLMHVRRPQLCCMLIYVSHGITEDTHDTIQEKKEPQHVNTAREHT